MTGKKRMAFDISEADANRIRAAYVGTRAVFPPATLSEFITDLLLEATGRLERAHNKGRPWRTPSRGELKSLSQTGVGRNAPGRTDEKNQR
ncbi:ParB family protein [Rhodococcus sp. NPDC003382]